MRTIIAIASVLALTAPSFAQTAVQTGRSAEVNDTRAPASALPHSAGSNDASGATQRGDNKPTATGGQPGGSTVTGR